MVRPAMTAISARNPIPAKPVRAKEATQRCVRRSMNATPQAFAIPSPGATILFYLMERHVRWVRVKQALVRLPGRLRRAAEPAVVAPVAAVAPVAPVERAA